MPKSTRSSLAEDCADPARLRSALRRFQRRSEQLLPTQGLTPRQYELLLMIATAPEPGARLQDLSERLQLALSTASELVHRAEEAGLVERRLDRLNRRGHRIFLTADGAQRLGRAVNDLKDERAALIRIVRELDGRAEET